MFVTKQNILEGRGESLYRFFFEDCEYFVSLKLCLVIFSEKLC